MSAVGAVSRMPFIEANIGIRSTLQVEGGPERPPDDASRPPVALVNQALARAHWPGKSPLGSHVLLRFDGKPLRAEVVGVVASVRHGKLEESPEPEAFLPHAQTGFGSMTYVLRTSPNRSRRPPSGGSASSTRCSRSTVRRASRSWCGSRSPSGASWSC